jgi:hypothetical protein
MSKCEICGKEGYHKLSCPTQKVTVFISDENPDQKEVRKRLIDRAVELQEQYDNDYRKMQILLSKSRIANRKLKYAKGEAPKVKRNKDVEE